MYRLLGVYYYTICYCSIYNVIGFNWTEQDGPASTCSPLHSNPITYGELPPWKQFQISPPPPTTSTHSKLLHYICVIKQWMYRTCKHKRGKQNHTNVFVSCKLKEVIWLVRLFCCFVEVPISHAKPVPQESWIRITSTSILYATSKVPLEVTVQQYRKSNI
jgi:hypothetical protein